MRFFGFIFIIIGLVSLRLAILNYLKLTYRKRIFKFNGKNSKFTPTNSGEYSIAVEGNNFNKINESNLRLIELKTNTSIELTPHGLTNKFFDDSKSYCEAFKIYLIEDKEYELIIDDYSTLKTHYSKYKIVEKYTVNKPPRIIVIEHFSNEKRIKFILASVLAVIMLFFAYAVIFLGNN